MKLWQAALRASFGHDTVNPKRSSIIRIVSMLLLAGICGAGSVSSLTTLTIPVWPQPLFIILPVIAATQIMLWLGFMGSTNVYANHGSIERLLFTLPLQQKQRYLVVALPYVCLTAILVTLAGGSIALLASKLGLQPFFICIGLLLGCVSAWGYFYCSRGLHPMAQAMLLVAIGALEVFGIRQYIVAGTTWQLAANIMLVVAGCTLVKPQNTQRHISSAVVMRGHKLPNSWWFMKKIVRSNITATSILLGLGISSGLGYFFYTSDIQDVSLVSFAAAAVAAACAADIHGTVRAHKPPEITALKGIFYFVRQYISSYWLVVLATAPLIYLTWYLEPTLQAQAYSITHISCAVGLGLCAGSLFTPVAGDIAAQTTAVLASVGLLGLPQFIPSLQGMSQIKSTLLHGALTLLLLVAIFCLEYKRNPFVWRRNHV